VLLSLLTRFHFTPCQQSPEQKKKNHHLLVSLSFLCGKRMNYKRPSPYSKRSDAPSGNRQSNGSRHQEEDAKFKSNRHIFVSLPPKASAKTINTLISQLKSIGKIADIQDNSIRNNHLFVTYVSTSLYHRFLTSFSSLIHETQTIPL
jgi:hypothetical protein